MDKKEGLKDGTAQHQKKHGQLEDGYNARWQGIVKFRRWVTADECRLAGWYHLLMTIGPEPKPICMGLTLHSLCVTHGPLLRTYKLFVRAYRGKTDEDLEVKHNNTANLQKWVSLYNTMLDNFKGEGHCVTMDSTYMGDIMALMDVTSGRSTWWGQPKRAELAWTRRKRRRQQRRTLTRL